MSAPGPAAEPHGPRQRRLTAEKRREDIVEQAIAYFAEVGFDGGTRELASRLGVTQPLLYRYFPTKDALIAAVYDAVFLGRWDEDWQRLIADRSRPLKERLAAFYRAYTDAVFERDWMRVYLFSGLKGGALNQRYMARVETLLLRPMLAEFRREAGLAPAAAPSPAEIELVWALHGGIFYYGVRQHVYGLDPHVEKDTVIEAALDAFIAGMGAVLAR